MVPGSVIVSCGSCSYRIIRSPDGIIVNLKNNIPVIGHINLVTGISACLGFDYQIIGIGGNGGVLEPAGKRETARSHIQIAVIITCSVKCTTISVFAVNYGSIAFVSQAIQVAGRIIDGYVSAPGTLIHFPMSNRPGGPVI